MIYAVSHRETWLVIHHPRGEAELQPVSPDVFEAPSPVEKVTFTRAAGGRVTGLKIDGGRVQHLRCTTWFHVTDRQRPPT